MSAILEHSPVDHGESERGYWSKHMDFILSCVGYGVGLGNVWRFPYLAYKNGGASFLFPYLLLLAAAGLPLYFLELALGQFASEGPITVWKMSPFFAGIGYAMVTLSGVVAIYYNVIIAYAVYYMLVAFVNLDSDLPWARCQKPWASTKCRDTPYPVFHKLNETEAMNAIKNDVYNWTCIQHKMKSSSFVDKLTETYPGVNSYSQLNSTHIRDDEDFFKGCLSTFVNPASDYMTRYVLRLHEADDIGHLGGVSPKILFTLALTWLLVFLCVMKGIKTSGRVVYFTVAFPYILLTVLLVRGVTLDGYSDGLKFFLVPTWKRLTEIKVWGNAATQIFYSLDVGFGGLLTMASYNRFKSDCIRNAIMLPLINCGTSIFAGFTIFSLMGHMAHVTNQAVEDVADSGPGLVFVAYPYGITKLPGQSFWAFLFFFMLFTLGLDSQFTMVETVVSAISDIFPRVLRKHKTLFTLVVCFSMFLLAIPLTTKGGMWVLTLMDWYSASYNVMFVALAEIICLMYVYGFRNFCDDVEMMAGRRPNLYWLSTWLVIAPIAVSFIIVVGAVGDSPAEYDDYVFEGWAQGIGWVMVMVPIAEMVIVGLVQMRRYGVRECFKPLPSWGPANAANRVGRYAPNTLPVTVDNLDSAGDKGASAHIPAAPGGETTAVSVQEENPCQEQNVPVTEDNTPAPVDPENAGSFALC